MQLESLRDCVFDIISDNPNSNIIEDYFLLYLEVLKRNNIDTSLSINELFTNHGIYKLPSTESVTRSKRYWRDIHPELFNNKNTEDKEEEYKQAFVIRKEHTNNE